MSYPILDLSDLDLKKCREEILRQSYNFSYLGFGQGLPVFFICPEKKFLPQQNHGVGYDLTLRDGIEMSHDIGETCEIGTGVRLLFLNGEDSPIYAEVFSRGSTYKKTGAILQNAVGVIDSSYRGEIFAFWVFLRFGIFIPNTNIRYLQLIFRSKVSTGSKFSEKQTVYPFGIISYNLFQELEQVFPSDRGIGMLGSTDSIREGNKK